MKIVCVAKNYGKHIAEMSGWAKEAGAAGEAKPAGGTIFFLKPDTALLRNNEPFYVPDFTSHVDYECELVVRIDRVGRSIAEKFANRYYHEVTLGIDFTARDQQRTAMAEGLPWEAAKAFDHSAALAPEWVPLAGLGRGVHDLRFEMALDGEVRQRGWTGDMIHGVDRVIADVSRYITLKIGDLIYTGTPAGVDAVAPGQRLTATLEGRELLNFEIR